MRRSDFFIIPKANVDEDIAVCTFRSVGSFILGLTLIIC